VAVRKIRSYLECVFDRSLGIPVAVHEHDRDGADDLFAEFVADVGARPNVGSGDVRSEVPWTEVARGRVGLE
jgi:hypothetical protein